MEQQLVSIGEMAKLCGVSVRALRYYEEADLLVPVLVNPDSGYRYYNPRQMYLADLIKFCGRFDIPLNEIKKYQTPDKALDIPGLLGKIDEMVQAKLYEAQWASRFLQDTKEKISYNEIYLDTGEIYERQLAAKFYFLSPCEKPFHQVGNLELSKTIMKMEADPIFEQVIQLWEFGLFYEKSQDEIKRYFFIEIEEPDFIHPQIIKIPEGRYQCVQRKESTIEKADEILEHSNLADRIIAIETEVFGGINPITTPNYELRVLSMVSDQFNILE